MKYLTLYESNIFSVLKIKRKVNDINKNIPNIFKNFKNEFLDLILGSTDVIN